MQGRKFLMLRYYIAAAGYALQDFGPAIGLSPQTLSSRLSGRVPWTVPEAMAACDVLNLDREKIAELFCERKEGDNDD